MIRKSFEQYESRIDTQYSELQNINLFGKISATSIYYSNCFYLNISTAFTIKMNIQINHSTIKQMQCRKADFSFSSTQINH